MDSIKDYPSKLEIKNDFLYKKLRYKKLGEKL